jgi:hypothetical protein
MGVNEDSALEVWNWHCCQDNIHTLKNRLGYGEKIWILGYELLADGSFMDPFHGNEMRFPIPLAASEMPSRHSATPEMYCILINYAASFEVPPSGEYISLASLDHMRRPELTSEECTDLLRYSEKPFENLLMDGGPFFHRKQSLGDLSFTIRPLPRIPITIVLWRGDQEMPPGGNLLFDSTAIHYLQHLLRELARLTIWRLRNILDPSLRWGLQEDPE